MKKKALLYGLSAALLLVSLTACGTSQADQPTEPDPTPTPSAVQTQPVETPAPTPAAEPMSATLPKATQEDLVNYFQMIYDMCQTASGADAYQDDDLMLELELKLELGQLHILFDIDPEFEKPADLDAQYLAWREANNSQEPEAEAPSSNPQTNNNQAQPVNAQTGGTGTTTQTGPGGATIVYDPSSDAQNAGFKDESLANGGQRFDADNAKDWEELGFSEPTDPSKIIYGGGN